MDFTAVLRYENFDGKITDPGMRQVFISSISANSFEEALEKLSFKAVERIKNKVFKKKKNVLFEVFLIKRSDCFVLLNKNFNKKNALKKCKENGVFSKDDQLVELIINVGWIDWENYSLTNPNYYQGCRFIETTNANSFVNAIKKINFSTIEQIRSLSVFKNSCKQQIETTSFFSMRAIMNCTKKFKQI